MVSDVRALLPLASLLLAASQVLHEEVAFRIRAAAGTP
jgi:hypothetical protein